MKRVDFGNGRTLSNIAATALPMFAAQALNLLYNIVDRIYIARSNNYGELLEKAQRLPGKWGTGWVTTD